MAIGGYDERLRKDKVVGGWMKGVGENLLCFLNFPRNFSTPTGSRLWAGSQSRFSSLVKMSMVRALLQGQLFSFSLALLVLSQGRNNGSVQSGSASGSGGEMR
ncbi:hypothetical protein Q7C36_019769 [Tachysurus vachellii]|uniref:Uncharacterized protein n=1 Tax=Tachysurus vachellii TaxID=175792 RepID=A0AA88LSD8_TACVA|nr:hypothetical protein Q7C36_019769 [Tachysurus vachellii]